VREIEDQYGRNKRKQRGGGTNVRANKSMASLPQATDTSALRNSTSSSSSANAATPMSTWTLAVFSALDRKSFEREFVVDATTSIAVLPERKIRCTDQDTLLSLVVLLCNEVVKNRREIPHDCSVDEHLWFFKILRPGEKSFESRRNYDKVTVNRLLASETAEEEESCDDVRPRMEITSLSPNFQCAVAPSARDDDDFVLCEHGTVKVSPDTKLGDLQAWGLTSQLHLEYDMGTTTNVFIFLSFTI
jgi:hypothetical protein